VTWSVAVAAGIGQLIAAVFPGNLSLRRTILFMLMLGLSRPAADRVFLSRRHSHDARGRRAQDFSCAPPPSRGGVPEQWNMVLLGFIASAIVSFIVVRWLLRYIRPTPSLSSDGTALCSEQCFSSSCSSNSGMLNGPPHLVSSCLSDNLYDAVNYIWKS